jgi:hypothetical protein
MDVPLHIPSTYRVLNDQTCIHWALSYFTSRQVVTFAEHVVRHVMKSSQMSFRNWNEFMSEFMSTFCPENKVTSALMQLESDHYSQGRHNVDIYINKFKDLIDMSVYIDSITIVLKFCRGLNMTIQDKIAESGTDRPEDNNHNGWFKAACQINLNHLANKAFHYASQHSTAQSTTL